MTQQATRRIDAISDDDDASQQSHSSRSSSSSSSSSSNSNPPSSCFDGDTDATDHNDIVGPAAKTSESTIGAAETRGVVRLRIVVALVLVGSAIAVALSTFYYITNSEQSQFENQFFDDSNKVLQTVGSTLDRTFGLLDHVAATMVSHARAVNQTWPFVTVPNFAFRVAKILPITNAIVMTVFPLVRPHQRTEWENYTIHNDNWVTETSKLQESWDGYYASPVDREEKGALYGDFGDVPFDSASPFHLPTWYSFPSIPYGTASYNWDYMNTSFAEALETQCVGVQKAIMTKPSLLPTPNDPVMLTETELWAEWYANFIPPTENPLAPMNDIAYPIINVVDRLSPANRNDSRIGSDDDDDVVGILLLTYYWRDMIQDILPPGSDGIHIVFENPCSLSFTYQINGPDVHYLGVGDHHDTSYDGLAVHEMLGTLRSNAAYSTTYSGVPLNDDYCPMTLHVYPSDDMKERYTSNNAIIFTVAVTAVFAFTSLVFYLFNVSVERRQTSVMKTAVRSTAIVSSLFPSSVRDQIYPHNEDAALTTHRLNKNKPGEVDGSSVQERRSIAQLYPETTVLFADISGFTAWCSTRQPAQVFYLLESIFAAFDEIAKKRGIFKVETIGDCYVAVVGLPTPRKHHAIAMVRFAADCRYKVNVLLQELDKTLGPGTAELAMRFGLNSGPTTAGVLRGEKTRFQLFGDTVNTAARMESNGERNKIHVSEETAEQIKLSGKGHWLALREEKVDCKGKGQMTTYWCNPKAGASGSIASESKHSQQDDVDSDMEIYKESPSRLMEW